MQRAVGVSWMTSLAQPGATGAEALPEPRGHVFDGGVFEAFDVIQVGMIEAGEQRLDGAWLMQE